MDNIQSSILYNEILEKARQISIEDVKSLRNDLDILIREEELRLEELNYEEPTLIQFIEDELSSLMTGHSSFSDYYNNK